MSSNKILKKSLIQFTENRVRRNYYGGSGLDRFNGELSCLDSDRPEDWIASTVLAKNPGLAPIANEGLAKVSVDGVEQLFIDFLAGDPEFYLGSKHVEKHGVNLGFLVKLLDSSMRLHVQAHPTADFARKYLDSGFGKLEGYCILGSREGVEPYIRFGFQHPPSPEEWKRIVFEQDIKAMDACFENIPVKPGDVWYIPGGFPHAIGEGLTMVEVMEPSDLVVRCEFVREGIEVPLEARFMNRDPEFALKIFDFTELTVKNAMRDYRVTPEVLEDNENYSLQRLIGNRQTPCFEILKMIVRKTCSALLDERFYVGVCLNGKGILQARDEHMRVTRSSRFFIPAAVEELQIQLDSSPEEMEMILCLPGRI
jgi:mannose-6-phosphate isomerase